MEVWNTVQTIGRVIRSHKAWSSLGALGLFGLLFDGFGRLQTGVGIVTWYYGPSWTLTDILSSITFKLICFAVVAFALWRIGRATLAQEHQREGERQLRETELEAARETARADMKAILKDATTLPTLLAKHHFMREQLQRLEEGLGEARAGHSNLIRFITEGESAITDTRGPLIVEEIAKFQNQFVRGRTSACFDPDFAANAAEIHFEKAVPIYHGTMQHQTEPRFYFTENMAFLTICHSNAHLMSQEIQKIERAVAFCKGTLTALDGEVAREMERLRTNA